MALLTPHRVVRGTCLALALGLSACSALPSRPGAVVRYDLGLTDLRVPQASAAAPSVAPVPLVLAPVQFSGLPEGTTTMLYRLNYADGQQLRGYQQARWSVPPAQMLEQRLRMRLGLERAVLAERDEVSDRTSDQRNLAVLRVELDEFSQVFDSAQSSAALVRLRASLIARDDATGGNVLQGQTLLIAQVPASTADAAGGAQAMARAADDVAAQLSLWLQRYGR